ncbi:heme A synthase [Sphingobacteriales bacterium UPWRP_1]|nr:hypothetical protein BVG80_03480 [Sphingobacteriales bacterium TSM_CSM]PSJ75626.1 heme A synthase [Sphingobacteriales bacterium UPWRP_1]
MNNTYRKRLGLLLLAALGVIYLQVIIGGITRLTGSGLSITEWKVVTGTLPPLTQTQWQTEFDKYRQTPQYHKLNKGMTLPEFKNIFFWEWLHRLWGRVGFLFVLGVFVFMFLKKQLSHESLRHFLIFLFLYLCQGLLGWIMVKSGLVDMPWVSHYRLTAHLLLAIVLFSYTLWFVADLLVPKNQLVHNPSLQKYTWVLAALLIVQIAFGGFMSGLRAAVFYPSFPTYNGQWIPANMGVMKPFLLNFTENVATIQFTHRSLAYLLFVLIWLYWYKARKQAVNNRFFTQTVQLLPVLLLLQFGLGITVLLLSRTGIPVGFGVAHQAVGLLLLSAVLFLGFLFTRTGNNMATTS